MSFQNLDKVISIGEGGTAFDFGGGIFHALYVAVEMMCWVFESCSPGEVISIWEGGTAFNWEGGICQALLFVVEMKSIEPLKATVPNQ